jgi:fructose-1-phosphate kinase PfkB-like protein
MMARTTPINNIKESAPVTKADVAGDPLLAAMLSNLQRAKEPALIVRLSNAIARVQEARRRNP